MGLTKAQLAERAKAARLVSLQAMMMVNATTMARIDAEQAELRKEYAQLVGEPQEMITVEGGTIQVLVKPIKLDTIEANDEIFAGLPKLVVNHFVPAAPVITVERLKLMANSAVEIVKKYAPALRSRVEKYKKRKLTEAKSKGDGSHLIVKVEPPKPSKTK